MSYLNLPAGIPNFAKAVISLWFRVPQETLDAAAAAAEEAVGDSPFNGIVPLVVFGNDSITGYRVVSGFTPGSFVTAERWEDFLAPFPAPPGTFGGYRLRPDSGTVTFNRTNHFYELGDSFPKAPCYIGIDTNKSVVDNYDPEDGGVPPKRNVLRMNIQMNNKPTAHNIAQIKASESGSSQLIQYSGGSPDRTSPANRSGSPPETFGPDIFGVSTAYVPEYNPYAEFFVFSDVTDVHLDANPELFTVKGNVEIAPDVWHHLLVSFDLTKDIQAEGVQAPTNITPIPGPDHGTVSTDCKIWLALDDANITGTDLHCGYSEADDYVSSRFSFGDNDLVSENAITTAITRQSANETLELARSGYIHLTSYSGFGVPTYSYTPGDIATANYPVGIPASAKYVDDVHKVEMAEFQMWTGITLDTAVEANRRAFLDYKRDEDGNPIPDEDGVLRLKPVKPAMAEVLLGKRPELLLHKTSKWKKGQNTGSLGQQPDGGELIPAGQFAPTGVIDKYKPDPSLIPA